MDRGLWTVNRYRIKGQEKHIVFSADGGQWTADDKRRSVDNNTDGG